MAICRALVVFALAGLMDIVSSGLALATSIVWEEPEIKSWVHVAAGEETQGKSYQLGGESSSATFIIKGKSFAKADARLILKTSNQNGLFFGQSFARTGYSLSELKKKPAIWNFDGTQAISGISLRQEFRIVGAPGGTVPGSAAIWGNAKGNGQFAFNTDFDDWMGAMLQWSLDVEALTGDLPWSGSESERIRDDTTQKLETALTNLLAKLTASTKESDILGNTLSFIQDLHSSIAGAAEVGDELKLGPSTRGYQPRSVMFNTNTKYTIKLDAIAAVDQEDGAWAIVDAFPGFNLGVWLGDAPDKEPIVPVPEPATLYLFGASLLFLVLSLHFGRRPSETS